MKKTKHLGVYGVIIENDKILLVKKSKGAYINKYDLPGGSFEYGEKPIETLEREIAEETGLNIKEATLLDANSALVEWLNHEEMELMHHIGIIYQVETKTGKVKQDADGHDSLGTVWINISNLTREMISPLCHDSLIKLGYKI